MTAMPKSAFRDSSKAQFDKKEWSNRPAAKYIRAQAATNSIANGKRCAKYTATSRSTNSGSNASMGATFALGGAQNGLSFQAGAQGSKGKANGSETTYSNTQIRVGSKDAPGTLNIASGGNTTLRGATASANTINADIKGKLVIESLQDTSNYDSKQTSVGAGVSLCIPPICYGTMVVVNVNAAQTKIDGDYASVGEQSALRAGDGGFNVKVGGDTTLNGGAITSTQKAIDDNKNSFATGGKLTATDLLNKSELDATSVSASLSTGSGSTSGSMGYGSVQDSRSSTTTASISGVAGNKDARTGDAQTGIKPVFTAADAAKIDKSLQVQTGVTAQFGQNASKAVGDYAGSKFKEAQAKGDAEGMALWKEGGAARVALHGVVGALTGGADGALGAVTSQTAVPLLGEQIAKLDIPVELKQALVLASGVGVGAVTGGGAGAASGGNATLNNYLTHTELKTKQALEKQKAAACAAPGSTACQTATKQLSDIISLDEGRDKMLKESCTGASANEAGCKAYKTEATAAASSINILNDSGIDAIAAADEKRQTNQLINNTLTPTPPLQGSYGAGFYTPLGGGEIEVDIERGQLTGVKLGLGVGAGAHITSGGVSGGMPQGATHGGKSPANESNPIQPGEARVGSSLSIGAGVAGC